MIRIILNRFRSFRYGLLLPIESVNFIFKHKMLMFWSLLPVVITIVLYTFIISYMNEQSSVISANWISNWAWDPGSFQAAALEITMKIATFILAAVSFAFTASIIATPFNDILARKTEKDAVPPLPPVEVQSWTNQLRLILIDMIKSTAATMASISALFFFLVPFLNLIVFFIACLLICFQFISYPQTRRGIGIIRGALFLWRHRWACTGFGASITFFFAVPVVSSLALPVAVVGGTLLVARAPGNDSLKRLR